ncbi:MAG: hypothetical protein J6J36_06650 [Clostridia bacterium]|nr:hypothetical protein [Clostridia bacterium]
MKVYSIQDDYANSRKVYGDLHTFEEWIENPHILNKYLDNGVPYRHTYYFSTQQKQEEFLKILSKKYKKEEQEMQIDKTKDQTIHLLNVVQQEYNDLLNTITLFKQGQEVFVVQSDFTILLSYYLGYDHFANGYVLTSGDCYEPVIHTYHTDYCFTNRSEAERSALIFKREKLEQELIELNKQIDEMGE